MQRNRLTPIDQKLLHFLLWCSRALFGQIAVHAGYSLLHGYAPPVTVIKQFVIFFKSNTYVAKHRRTCQSHHLICSILSQAMYRKKRARRRVRPGTKQAAPSHVKSMLALTFACFTHPQTRVVAVGWSHPVLEQQCDPYLQKTFVLWMCIG